MSAATEFLASVKTMQMPQSLRRFMTWRWLVPLGMVFAFLCFIGIMRLLPQTPRCVAGNCENGRGRAVFPAGGVYAGGFKNGEPDGFGVFEAANKDRYEGQWSDGRKHGFGKYVYADGTEYAGQFQRNVKSGKGTFKWGDGTQLTGEWKNGSPEGRGVLTLPDETRLEGVYKDGRIYSGAGVFIYADGSKYVGEWKGGKREGKGILMDASGSVVNTGMWKAGEPEHR